MAAGRTTIGGSSCHRAGIAGHHGSVPSSSGHSHSVKAGPAPNQRRTGLRSSSTSSRPMLRSSRLASISALLLLDGVDERAQFGHVALAQLLVGGEVGEQGRYASAEYAVEQVATLARLPLLAGEQRTVEVASAVALGAHRRLAEQPVEQGADGLLVPVGGFAQRRDDLFRAARRVLPQHG